MTGSSDRFVSKDGGPVKLAGGQASKADNGSAAQLAVREVGAEQKVAAEEPTVSEKVKELLVGKPLDLADQRIYHHISLIAFLAWVGLGADGLSSSCYGPSEAFHHLSGHHHLAV